MGDNTKGQKDKHIRLGAIEELNSQREGEREREREREKRLNPSSYIRCSTKKGRKE